MTLINRKRLTYTFYDIIHFLFACMCFRNLKSKKTKGEYKKHYLYQKCEERLNTELDIINLLKNSRQIKILTQTLLS